MAVMGMLDDQDWRSQGLCEVGDADLHFIEIEDLVEDGHSVAEAEVLVGQAQAEAKALCDICPVKTRCLAAALANQEEYGTWGGCTAEEREEISRSGAEIREAIGTDLPARTVEATSPDRLHPNPGVNATYQKRLRMARAVLEKLRELPDCWSFSNRAYGTHYKPEYMQLFELIVRYPDASAQSLAERLDRKAAWFNNMTQNCRQALGVEV